jgi:hypothetical protein
VACVNISGDHRDLGEPGNTYFDFFVWIFVPYILSYVQE